MVDHHYPAANVPGRFLAGCRRCRRVVGGFGRVSTGVGRVKSGLVGFARILRGSSRKVSAYGERLGTPSAPRRGG